VQIPNYEVLEPIGEGGFAIVYKARRKKDSLLVAIKVPKVPDKNFVKELAVWLNLNHPNIVKLLDYDIDPRPYMVMELMNGTLHGKTFDKDTATRIILDVLSGIPREDSISTGVNPYVADAIVLSYVTDNNQFTVDTVSDYNNYDYTMNCGPSGICLGNQKYRNKCWR
jgi:serine/threonine protein kinase